MTTGFRPRKTSQARSLSRWAPFVATDVLAPALSVITPDGRSFAGRLPPFTGLKRYVGHTLGACGAIETGLFLGCLRAGFLPSTAGFQHADAALQIQPLTHAVPAGAGHYLLNFFGFGGNYASLIVRHA